MPERVTNKAHLMLISEAEQLRDLIIGYEMVRCRATVADGIALETLLDRIHKKSQFLQSSLFSTVFYKNRGNLDYYVSAMQLFKLIEDELQYMVSNKEVFLEIPLFMVYIKLLHELARVGMALCEPAHKEE